MEANAISEAIAAHYGPKLAADVAAAMKEYLLRGTDPRKMLPQILDSKGNPAPQRLLPPVQNGTPATKADELGLKCAAKMLLADPLKRIIVPTCDEWHGVMLLECDDELPPRRKAR
jgi:hypothetical protein